MHKRASKLQPSPSQEEADLQLLRISEVAEILRIARTSVYRLIHEEGLPVISLGSKGDLRVKRASLRQWIATREQGENPVG